MTGLLQLICKAIQYVRDTEQKDLTSGAWNKMFKEAILDLL